MLKKLLIGGVVIVIVMGVVGYFIIRNFLFPFGHELDITIYNDTDVEVSELFLTYRGLQDDFFIDSIDTDETYHTRISATDNVDESSLVLYYYDNNNILHEHTVIGYFERRGSGQASEVTINSVDENGVMDITVVFIRL